MLNDMCKNKTGKGCYQTVPRAEKQVDHLVGAGMMPENANYVLAITGEGRFTIVVVLTEQEDFIRYAHPLMQAGCTVTK